MYDLLHTGRFKPKNPSVGMGGGGEVILWNHTNALAIIAVMNIIESTSGICS